MIFSSYSQSEFELSYSNYFAKNNLTWSISGNILGRNPNIYSELYFNDIWSWGQNISIRRHLFHNVNLNLSFKNLKVLSGNGTDSDYAGDNRTEMFSQLNFISKKGAGQVYDVGLSYNLQTDKKLSFVFGLGYTLHYQTFFLNSREIVELNSTYKIAPKLYGIFIGVGKRFFSYIDSNLFLQVNGVDYFARGNWNMIKEFKHPISFVHNANGYSIGVEFKNKFQINKNFSFSLSYSQNNHNYLRGVDILNLRATNIPQYTRFNGGSLISNIYSIGLVYVK